MEGLSKEAGKVADNSIASWVGRCLFGCVRLILNLRPNDSLIRGPFTGGPDID